MALQADREGEGEQENTCSAQLAVSLGLAKNSFSEPAAPAQVQKGLRTCCLLVFVSSCQHQRLKSQRLGKLLQKGYTASLCHVKQDWSSHTSLIFSVAALMRRYFHQSSGSKPIIHIRTTKLHFMLTFTVLHETLANILFAKPNTRQWGKSF